MSIFDEISRTIRVTPSDNVFSRISQTVQDLPVAPASQPQSTIAVAPQTGGFLGGLKNVASGLYEGVKTIGRGIVEQYTKPSEITRQVERGFSVGQPAPIPALQPFTTLGDIATKAFLRTFTPLVAPLGKDIGERILLREIAPKIQSGELPPDLINQFETLNKTAPQIIGDVGMAVLSAYSPTLFGRQVLLLKNAPIKTALISGGVRGAEAGLGFGTAGALASGTNDPTEFAKQVVTSVVTLGVLGAITSGALPVASALRNKVIEAQNKLEQELIAKGYAPTEAKTLAQRGGFVGELPGKESKPEAQKGKSSGLKERGFITSAKEAVPEATKIAGQYIPRPTDLLAIKARNLIKDDINAAEKLALTGTDDQAVATASELIKNYNEKASLTTDKAIQNALYDQTAKIANTIAPKLTESGRTVQAASILGRLTPEGQVRFAAREIQRYNETAGLAKKIPELTGEQAGKIVEEMRAVNQMADGTEKAMRFQKLQNYISDLVPTPLFKKIIAVWKAGLLTGIKTSGLNIFANISHAVTEIAKDIPATIVDKVVSLFTGERKVALGVKGILGGAKEGASKGLRYLTTGFDERNIGTKLDYKRVNFGKGKLAKGLQTYTDTVFRILGTEDQPFYYASKLRSLYEQSKVQAINKGLKGAEAQKFIDNLIQNPTDEMVRYASFDAETAVFQNKTVLGQAARSIQKIGGGVGEIVVPFGRTPSAVAMQILNYSPVGIVKTIFENVGKGRFDQRLFSQGLGRGLTGTGVLALGALLYRQGMITTARPMGEKEQKLWELEGKQPNSVKIGGKWRQVQVLGPVGNLLLMGGSFQKAFDNSGSPSEAMAMGLADASQSFTQQTFLTGVSNFIDAMSDPARSAKSVAASTLASTIPTFVVDVARATDTKERRANEIMEKFQARIPGIREMLEPQVNVLGQEKPTTGNPLEIMADPTRPSPGQSTLLVEELRRLWDAGFKVSPTLLGDKSGYSSLAPQENTELWKRAGEIINSKLSNLLQSSDYLNAQDDQKAKYIESFIDKSKTNARAEMVIKLTQGIRGEELKTKLSELKKSGLMTREVFNQYLELR